MNTKWTLNHQVISLASIYILGHSSSFLSLHWINYLLLVGNYMLWMMMSVVLCAHFPALLLSLLSPHFSCSCHHYWYWALSSKCTPQIFNSVFPIQVEYFHLWMWSPIIFMFKILLFIFTYLFLGCLFNIYIFPILIIILVIIIIIHVESMLSSGPSTVNFRADWYSLNWIAFYTIYALNNRLAAYKTWEMYSFLEHCRCSSYRLCFGHCFDNVYVWAGSAGKCWLVCLFELLLLCSSNYPWAGVRPSSWIGKSRILLSCFPGTRKWETLHS